MKTARSHHQIQKLSYSFFFTKVGEFTFEIAFAVTVVSLVTGNLLDVGLIYFLRFMPSALFSPVGGWLADYADKKYTLITVDLLKLTVAISLCSVGIYSSLSIQAIAIAAMCLTALDCLHTPSFRAFFPETIDSESLTLVNSRLQVIEDGASIAGPLIFSIITIMFTPLHAFAFFSISSLMSTLYILTLESSTRKEMGSFSFKYILKDAINGLQSIKHMNKPLFKVIFCTTLCALFATSLIRFILPAAVMDAFESEAAVGYTASILAAGTVLGSLSYVRFNPTTTADAVVRYWSIYGSLFLATAISLTFSNYIFLALLAFVGFVGAFVDIAIVTNIQRLSHPKNVGRNYSLYYFTAVIGDGLSGIIASLMFLIAGPATFIGMASLLCISPLAWKKKNANKNCI
ncbi:MFS transporter [Pseudomonas sp. RC10]|uniref:MFS transporter n=1 Tax=Pseudomonas bambusae TaxID=3139142 RepID=UPI00313A0BDC